jgi:Putative peptidoglycan binding domain
VIELERLLGIQRLLFERPKESDLLPLEGETALRLTRILIKLGHLRSEPERWNETAQHALESLAGIENLEERIVAPRDGKFFVDPIMLGFLEQKFGR